MTIGAKQITPYLAVEGASKAIDWYKKVFGATEMQRMTDDKSGKLMHGHIQIDGLDLMVADDWPDFGVFGPKTLGGTAVSIHLDVIDCDAVYATAMDNGATNIQEPNDAFWGDRFAKFTDPFGHNWSVSHKQRSVSEADQQKAAKDWSDENT